MRRYGILLFALLLVVAMCASGCQQTPAPTPSRTPMPTSTPVPSRAESIPPDAVKGVSETDLFPPVLHSDAWEPPVPMAAPITTAGQRTLPSSAPMVSILSSSSRRMCACQPSSNCTTA